MTTFTPVPTLTPAPTFTPWYIFTPTPEGMEQQPTPTPAVFDIDRISEGRAVLQITTTNPDAILLEGIALAAGEITVMGQVTATDFRDVRLEINLRPDNNASALSWTFRFHAPDLQIGPVYQTDPKKVFDDPDSPGIYMRPPGVDMSPCNRVQGEFRIEAVEPHLIIAFTHTCNQDTTQEIRGRIVIDLVKKR